MDTSFVLKYLCALAGWENRAEGEAGERWVQIRAWWDKGEIQLS